MNITTIIHQRLFTTAIGILIVLILAACSRSFFIKPVGHLDDSVIFHFSDSLDARTQTTLNIIEFYVQEATENTWVTVWELKGEASLELITYGAKHKDLVEVVPARPLTRSGKYRAIGTELTGFNPIGYASIHFSFGEDGALLISDVPFSLSMDVRRQSVHD